VASVPVSAVAFHTSTPAPRSLVLAEYFEEDGRLTLARLYTTWGVEWWFTVSQPEDEADYARALAQTDGAWRVADDPRPPTPRPRPSGEAFFLVTLRAGWPLRAAYFDRSFAHDDAAVRARGQWTLSVSGERWPIPVLPLWIGLLGNTLFYAVLVLTPIVLWRWRRLRRRARRGRCLACGYEPGEGVRACPECGLANLGSPGSGIEDRAPERRR